MDSKGGRTLGPVTVTFPGKEGTVELPEGTPIPEVLNGARKAFGDGFMKDGNGFCVVPSSDELEGGIYTWRISKSIPAAYRLRLLYFYQKEAGLGDGAHVRPVTSDADGRFLYSELAAIAGFSDMFPPKCLIFGNPELMRAYLNPDGKVELPSSGLGDWGTFRRPLPVAGAGCWDSVKEWWASIKAYIWAKSHPVLHMAPAEPPVPIKKNM